MTLPSPIEQTPPAAPGKKPSGLVWAGAILIVLSSIGGVFSLVRMLSPAFDAINSPTMSVPGSQSFTLEDGTYTLYERTGRSTGGFPTGSSGLTSVSPSQITVTSPSGSTVPVVGVSYSETLDDGAVKYTGVGQFRAASAGSYRIDIRSETSTQVKVGPSVLSLGEEIVVWIFALMGAGILFFVGVVLLIVGLVRRSRAGKAGRGPTGPGGPGYGPPGYGAPAYGAPGYGAPGYGAPGYGAPGYGAPGATPPGGPVPPTPPPERPPPRDPWA